MSDEKPPRLVSVPVPRWAIGDKVFAVLTQEGAETFVCPDCLGEGTWLVKSPAGYETSVACPRCNGARKLGLRIRTASACELTIGSIRINTEGGYNDEYVQYMCEETGIGSGTLWGENGLKATLEEATEAARIRALEETARIDNGPDQKARNEFRHLSTYTLRDAAQKEAENRAWHAEYDLRDIVNRLADLGYKDTDHISSYQFEEEQAAEKRPGYAFVSQEGIKPELLKLIAEHVVSYREGPTKMLKEARLNAEKECKC